MAIEWAVTWEALVIDKGIILRSVAARCELRSIY